MLYSSISIDTVTDLLCSCIKSVTGKMFSITLAMTATSLSVFPKLPADVVRKRRNRRRRSQRRKNATGTVTLGSKTTTTLSGEGRCGRSGSKSDIKDYAPSFVKQTKRNRDVSA